MTISAKAEGRGGDVVARAFDLYRDLSVALKRTVDDLSQTADGGKGHTDLLRVHQRSLQSVMDIEASFGQRSQAPGGGVELDLDAARAEILARLARWSADR